MAESDKYRKCSVCKDLKPMTIEFFGRVTSIKHFKGFQYHCRLCVNKHSKTRDRRKYWAEYRFRKDPIKVSARERARAALKGGKIIKQKCFCGEEKTEMHHPDYSQPLQVVFLCPLHHARLHSPNFIQDTK